MNTILNVRFLLRAPKKSKNGFQTIYLRLSVGLDRSEISTRRLVDPALWDPHAERLVGPRRESIRQLNSYLDTLQAQVFQSQRELMNKGIEVNVNNIKDKIFGNDLSTKTLLNVYKEQVEQVKALVGKDYAPGTLKRYRAALSSLEAFLKDKKKEGVLVRDLNYQFILDYEFFLKSIRNIEHNTAMGIIKKLKKIVRHCVATNLLEKDPFMSYKVKIRDTNRPYLIQEELDKMIQRVFVTNRLDKVRDTFVFCCFTGLAYSDVQKLSRKDIVTGIDGEKWIHTHRTKTETATRLPILAQAMQILDKYARDPQCINEGKLLPVMSNAKMGMNT